MSKEEKKLAEGGRKEESLRFRVRGNSRQRYRLLQLDSWNETADEYVGCSGEKWFSLGFGAAFRFACISSPGGGFFSAPQLQRGRRKTTRYGSAMSALPLYAPCIAPPSPSDPLPRMMTCPPLSCIYGHSSINEPNDEYPFREKCPHMRLSINLMMSMTLSKFLSVFGVYLISMKFNSPPL